MTNATIEAPSEKMEATKQALGFFGHGRYSNVASELFRDAQRILGISEIQSDKLARAFMADFGRNAGNVTAWGIGNNKKNSDGVTLKEAAERKDVILTHALTLARLVVKLDACRKFGVLKFEKIQLVPQLQQWLDEA